MHTSGSTGLPAPVTPTHWSISTTDQHHLVAPLDGRPTVWGDLFDARRRNYLGWPISSSSGIGAGITDICFNNITTVLGPPEQTTIETLLAMVRFADVDSASCTPAVLEELARRPDALANLRGLKHIAYVGGWLFCQQNCCQLTQSSRIDFSSRWRYCVPVHPTCNPDGIDRNCHHGTTCHRPRRLVIRLHQPFAQRH